MFLKYAEYLQDPGVRYNDPVFCKMSEELEHKMTPMALYITLKRHRNDIFVPNDQTSTDVETFNDETQLTSGCSSPASQSSERESFGFTVNDNDARSFSFLLDIYDWKKVTPLSSHRRRSSTSRFFHFKLCQSSSGAVY